MTRRPPARKPAAEAVALVALEGGPIGGVRVGVRPNDPGELRGAAWYTAADWAEQRRLAQWSRQVHGHGLDHPTTAALRYVETAEWTPNPAPVQWPQGGTVWRWQRRPADE